MAEEDIIPTEEAMYEHGPEDDHDEHAEVSSEEEHTSAEHEPEEVVMHETTLEAHSPEPEIVSDAGAHEEPASVEPPPSLGDPDKNWYIIHTYSGFEQKVAESLKGRAQAYGFSEQIGQILIPTEEVVELRAGKKVTSKRLLYPGYVLVQMEMNDKLWHEVKNTPRVTGFVGGGNSPVPLTQTEVDSILNRQAATANAPRPKMTFEKNETVRIVDGPFANFSGKIDEINMERNTLRVLVTIFGRATPVELDFLQVEKL